MSDFWDNILRFPRFFISSTLGLILTIIGPFFNLLKSPQTSLILFSIILIIVIFLFLTLKAMLNLDIDSTLLTSFINKSIK
uniref:Uncharacterized protein ycf33 n=1 Tax=Cryptomonas curvata TaxID=233186 RepID=A0A679CA43_9CRYP|nr:ycf33 protein [Cryptomonas curvata]